MHVRQFVDEGLGNSTHLVISTQAGVAALVDPLRDVDRYLEAAAAAGVRISHVFETHVHNDFVTGSRELLIGTARYFDRYQRTATDGWQIVRSEYFRIAEVREPLARRPTLVSHYLAEHGTDVATTPLP